MKKIGVLKLQLFNIFLWFFAAKKGKAGRRRVSSKGHVSTSEPLVLMQDKCAENRLRTRLLLAQKFIAHKDRKGRKGHKGDYAYCKKPHPTPFPRELDVLCRAPVKS